MKSKTLSKAQKETVQKYSKLYPEYKKLSQELRILIKSVLRKSGIEFFDVTGRPKKISSFQNKMIRKKYKNPLFDIKDLCAIRIICNFPEEVKQVEAILQNNFKILDFSNQEKNISPHKFWYRSHHFELQLNKKQITKNKYKLLKHFIAEVQVRTVFMDAWAIMEHKINYKHEWNTSHDTKRKLSRLSALLELADEQLEELAKNKNVEYKEI